MSDVWQKRVERERRARKEAEQLLEEKSRELFLKITELEATKHRLESLTGELTVALEGAAAASQAKSQFLSTMSHELRTPLNAIIGFSEMLKSELMAPLGQEHHREWATIIYDSGAHLLALINDILDISKLDAGRLELNEEAVDLAEAVASCVQLMRPQAEKSGVILGAVEKHHLPSLRADRRRLHQILLNLTSNAVKFTPRGGEVKISFDCGEEGFTLRVADTGIGMTSEQIPIAFERFGQIDSKLAREYEGTGLGLPLTKHLVELHGGSLILVSELGVGTTVTIHFPMERVLSRPDAA